MDAHKTLVTPILLLQKIVAPVDFTDFCHHGIHILDAFLRLRRVLWYEALLTEVFAELVGKNHILVLSLVKISLKFSLHLVTTLTDVIHDYSHFLRDTFLELKIKFRESYVDNARNISHMLGVFHQIDAFDTVTYLRNQSWNADYRQFFNL